MIRRARNALLGLLLVAIVHTQAGTPEGGGASGDSVRGPVLRLLPRNQQHIRPFGDQTFPSYRRPRIGLVLSGGGARGLSQIGVLRALEEAGIRPDFVSGTSIGSIIGGLYAAGYSVDQLERAITSIDWDELLRLSNQGGRENLFVDQKPVSDRSIVTILFDGLRPVIPQAVSNGQRLTNLLNDLVLRAPYHSANFDELSIPFRAVATDLYSGTRVVLSSGSLAEALRASATIPVLYSPVTRDSLALVDGGMNANIPADLARAWGCDLVIVVNTTSPPRHPSQITNPLETLDQVLNILMEKSNAEQLRYADVVITPDLGDHLATDFDNADSLIIHGYHEAATAVPAIRDVQRALLAQSLDGEARGVTGDTTFHARFPDRVLDTLARLLHSSNSRSIDVAGAGDGWAVSADFLPRLRAIRIIGAARELEPVLRDEVEACLQRPVCAETVRRVCERTLGVYRSRGYALAKIDSVTIDTLAGRMELVVREGRIGSVFVEGNSRTDTVVILREFPLRQGQLFRTEDARTGMDNITSLNLFHQVSFSVDEELRDPTVSIRVEERPSQVLQISALVDDERNAQAAVELRDANFLGTGSELAGSFFGGFRNRRYTLRYNTNRVWYTNLGLKTELYYDIRDFNTYRDTPGLPFNRFAREIAIQSRRVLLGAQMSAGFYAGRFGYVTGALTLEHQELNSFATVEPDATGINEEQRVVSFSIGTTIDTQDRFPYPRKGMYLLFTYVSAQTALGSEAAFTRVRAQYDVYITAPGQRWTVHPRVLFGYGDRTMPRTEDFRLGGLATFYGMRESEFTGQQVFVGSVELRTLLPVKFLFDSYLLLRYDLGRTWDIPEQIKFADLRHGAGIAIGLDTPIGPADFGIGRSFLFARENGKSFTQWGPTALYFSVGIGL
jgi:NTE family protein